MSISKKIRFEVFKRDGFRCQYCGKVPPNVTLEIDHINPKSKKGEDDINNLITACFDCNRGKKHYELKNLPNTIKQNLEILKEKELQLKEYNEMIIAIQSRLHNDSLDIEMIWEEEFDFRDLGFSDNFRHSVIILLKKLPKQTLIDIMRYSCTKMKNKHPDDMEEAANASLKYFCGVAWRRIREGHDTL